MLVLLAANMVFAQEKASNVKNNWLSGELSLIGAGARYERMFNSAFSIGAVAYYSYTFFILYDTGADVFARWYPWGKTFYTGLGVGFHMTTIINFEESSPGVGIIGAAITPEIGWKIDTGRPGGFFIQPGIKIPITLGVNNYTNAFDVYAFPIVYFGLGFSF